MPILVIPEFDRVRLIKCPPMALMKEQKQNSAKLEMFARAEYAAVWRTGVRIKRRAAGLTSACHLVGQNIIAVALRTAAFGR